MLFVTLMMKIVFLVNFYLLIHKFQSFVKLFTNNSSANTKLSNTQFYKIGQSAGFLGGLLGPLLRTGLPLIENELKLLPKSVLIPLGLTETA